MTQAFPLHWPKGRPRTEAHERDRSRFDQTLSGAISAVLLEIRRMNGAEPVISTNMETRSNGLPRGGQSQPEDQGVAVYFTARRSGQWHQMAFACDRWDRVHDNIYAIAKTIDALRGIERWGSGEMMEAAFSGFASLPPPQSGSDWRIVFEKYGFPRLINLESIEIAYRSAAQKAHPDKAGSNAAMAELNAARDLARRELA